jgi:hypothetical protein
MSRKNYSIGIVLIAIAVILLLGKLGVFHFLGSILWPLFVLVPGLIFHLLYFNRIFPAAVLVPGGILVTYSLMFIYCNMFGWNSMGYLWPGFIFGVAVGLYEMYWFERSSDRRVLLAAMVVGGISVVFFAMTILFKLGIYVIVIVLLLAGAWMMLRKPKTW